MGPIAVISRRPGGLTSSDTLVGNYLEDQRAALFARMLELLLIRPAGRTGAIAVHPAEPPFRVHFPDSHLSDRPGLGLGKANCGYKFHVNRRTATFGAALTPPQPVKEGLP
jgi:hypothetical protein